MSLNKKKKQKKKKENVKKTLKTQKLKKTLIFPRVLQKLQTWVKFTFFSCLKFFCFPIIKKMMFIVSVKPN